jgi:ketosteroid isomerase-like protein
MWEEDFEIQNEAVREFFSAFDGEDDAFGACLHPEIEWYPIEENRTPNRGVDAALRNRNEWLETWEEHELGVEEAVEDGDDVVVLVHIRARGRGSGIETDVRFYAQFKVRDGKVAYIYDHEDRNSAMQAAGLSE